MMEEVKRVLEGKDPQIPGIEYSYAAAFVYDEGVERTNVERAFWCREKDKDCRKYRKMIMEEFDEWLKQQETLDELLGRILTKIIREEGYLPNIKMDFIGGDYWYLELLIYW